MFSGFVSNFKWVTFLLLTMRYRSQENLFIGLHVRSASKEKTSVFELRNKLLEFFKKAVVKTFFKEEIIRNKHEKNEYIFHIIDQG